MCVFTYSRRDRCFKPDADYGQCADKNPDTPRFQTRLALSRHDCVFLVIVPRPHDIQFPDELVENFVRVVPTNKGFIDEFR